MAALGLTAFIDQAEGQVMVWGQSDCALWLANWGIELTGIDGGAEWRGRYSTWLGCKRLLTREGGILNVVRQGAEAIGMQQVEELQEGDVGVLQVISPKGPDMAGGIYTGDGFWAVRAARGVVLAKLRPLASWGLR